MGAHYPVLRYPGNVSGNDAVQPGCLLGWDETGRPYEVIDAEYIPREIVVEDGGDDTQRVVDVRGRYTNVYLQYAQPENIRRQASELQASSLRIAQLGQRAGARVVGL
jgi:hypothetical protein